MYGQLVRPMRAPFTHEQHHAAVFDDDDPAVLAGESRSGVDDHWPIQVLPPERPAAVKCVIGCLAKGNGDAVPERRRTAHFHCTRLDPVTTLVVNYKFVPRFSTPADAGLRFQMDHGQQQGAGASVSE
jgi:hypothetical protein